MNNTTNTLQTIKQDFQQGLDKYERRIIVCAGTGCVSSGSLDIHQKLQEEIEENGYDVDLKLRKEEADTEAEEDDNVILSKSGCQGFCQMGPLVEIQPDGYLYTHVEVDDVEKIVEKTIENGEPVEDLLFTSQADGEKYKGRDEIPFYELQSRSVLKKCGSIDPEDIREYISLNGYEAAEQAYTKMSPKEVCEVVEEANLRGRGGGGFPAGVKWNLTRKEEGDKKYVICNGDEGDPGAFMDRSVLEGTPHSVIEGMMIAARAIGADEGYIYVRMEYPLAVKRVRKAVEDAREMGLLGENIFGTEHSFDINIMEGAGAFVCGEETALMNSVEGKRGMPEPKPPYPAQQGLFGKPTNINNVETLATVPMIIEQGAEQYKEIGTEDSPGTKTFALTGHVVNTGLIEVPLGTTLREIIFDIGGGVTDAKGNIDNDNFKAVQIGGPSGGCLTRKHLDIPVDFDSLIEAGAMVGSGGLVVMNQDTCMIQVAKFFMKFTQEESCGKCVLCREGTKQMLNLLNKITEGKADQNTLTKLEKLGQAVKKGSLCGLGKTAPNPVLSTMDLFEEEYRAHVEDNTCPVNECDALSVPEIDPEECKGCTICAKECPVDAIEGEPQEVHRIIAEDCINCGTCIEACKFNAIS